MSRGVDITGQRFGKLTVIKQDGRSKEGGVLWLCSCECGGSITTRSNQLRQGRALSCGCSHTKHGFGYDPLYGVWRMMMKRCYDPSNKDYRHYGARGIQVCPQWHLLDNFIADMRPRPGLGTLERIDVNGPYIKSNCRWATQKEQTRNARSNIVLTYNGKSQCLGAWAEELGIKYHSLYHKVVTKKWPLEKALGL
jgi:hypothetical protein